MRCTHSRTKASPSRRPEIPRILAPLAAADTKKDEPEQEEEGGLSSAKSDEDRQCPGLRGRQCVGEQDLMSQRGSAPRPVSRRQSTSRSDVDAATFTQPSSQSLAQAGPSQGDGQRRSEPETERPSTVVTEDDGRSFFEERRATGVHDTHHAPVPRPPFPGSIASVLHGAVERENAELDMRTTGERQSEYAVLPAQHYTIQGEPLSAMTQPRYPPLAPTVPPASVNPGVQRGSPTMRPALPPIGAQRRILTPMSPRAVSLGRATAKVAPLQQTQPPLPSTPALGQYMSSQSGPALPGGSGLPQIQTLGHEASQPSLTSPGPMRSVSHSIVGRSPLQAVPTEPSLQRPSPFQPSLPVTRDILPGGQFTASRWSHGSARGWAGGLPLQPMFSITPQSGEEILVPVDTQQGSKSADERRLRNAGASQRFRSRKKEKENLMEEETRRLHAIARDLERQRDFYRSERNRLRDIVAQTPGISERAYGPPTPPPPSQQSGPSPEMSNRTIENLTNTTSSRRRTTQTRPHPYESEDTSESGPPSRRRRTEHRSGIRFTSPSFEMPPMPRSSTLPAIYSQPLGLQSPGIGERPLLPGSDARLPPLRLEGGMEHVARPLPPPQSPLQPHQGPGQGRPSPLPPVQTQHQPQPQPPYPYGRAPVESGWATYPRGPPDAGQR